MRLTEEQYAALLSRKPVAVSKPAKFGNVRCKSMDGKSFQSRLERDYYEQLLLRWKAGDVLWFIRQPSFDLEGGVIYRADFLVVTKTQGVEVIDTKGYAKQEGKNKIKQVEARYGIKVQLVRKV